MASRPADPFDIIATPKPIAVGFDRSGGEPLVYGATLIGSLVLAVSIASNIPAAALVAAAAFATAFWHYPMVEKGQPQLGANEDGLFVERIGFLDWGCVAGLELSNTSVRSIRIARLVIALNRPLTEAIAKPHAVPAWKRLMMRNWKQQRQKDGQERLIVDLHTLAGQPEDILARLRGWQPT